MARILSLSLVLIIVIASLMGCSSSEGVSEDEYEQVKDDLARVQQDLLEAEQQIEALKSNLNGAQKAETPVHFSSFEQLQKWAKSNIIPGAAEYADDWFKKAVKVQADASEAGYIVSVNVEYIPEADSYTVTCNAIAAGQLYWWDPEAGDVFDWGPDFQIKQ